MSDASDFAETPLGRTMGDNADEELYTLLLHTADETPLHVLSNCMVIMATVMRYRLNGKHDAEKESVADYVLKLMTELNLQLVGEAVAERP